MNKYKIIFMGTSPFAKEMLITLSKISNLDIISVVCQPDSIVSRNKNKTFPPVKEESLKLGIKVLQPIKISTIKEEIKSLNPDFIITCAYGQFVPESILNIPKDCINIHASFLPKLRGGAPIHWAILNGHEYSGITFMRMIKKMDAGAIFFQEKVSISKEDTTKDLEQKLITLAKEMINNSLLDLLNKITNNNHSVVEQNESEATFGYNITREDEKIDFNESVVNVYNKIRGLYDKPIAYGLLEKTVCKILKSDYIQENTDNNIKNGTIIKLDKLGIHLKLKDGYLILKEIQLEGKKPQQTNWYYKNAPKKIYIGGIYE